MKSNGFSLLEAIIALVLLTSTGLALFGWINTNLISLQRIQQFQYRQEATQSALAFIETVNPLATPTGEETIGNYELRWQANVVKPPLDGISPMGNKGIFQVGLYATTVEVKRKIDGTLLAQFTVRQLGFKQTRKPHAWFYDESEM